ncbi:MAG: IS701 family transposase, partial [Cyanobacteria bacterium P01_F01_bin.86]
KGIINNCYEISRQLFVPVIRQFILDNVAESTFSSHHEHDFVNA